MTPPPISRAAPISPESAVSRREALSENRLPAEPIDSVALGPEVSLAELTRLEKPSAEVVAEQQRLYAAFQGQTERVVLQRIGTNYFYVAVHVVGERAFDPMILASFDPARPAPLTAEGLEFDCGPRRPQVQRVHGHRQVILASDPGRRPENPLRLIVPTTRRPRGAPRLLIRDQAQSAAAEQLRALFAQSPYTIDIRDGEDGPHLVIQWADPRATVQWLDLGPLTEAVVIRSTPPFVAIPLGPEDLAVGSTTWPDQWQLRRVPAREMTAPQRFLYIPVRGHEALINRARRSEVDTQGRIETDDFALARDVTAILTGEERASLRLSQNAFLSDPLHLTGLYVADIWPREGGPRERPSGATLPPRDKPTPQMPVATIPSFRRYLPAVKPVPAVPEIPYRFPLLNAAELPPLPPLEFTDPPIVMPPLATELAALLPEAAVVNREVNTEYVIDHSGSMGSAFRMMLDSY